MEYSPRISHQRKNIAFFKEEVYEKLLPLDHDDYREHPLISRLSDIRDQRFVNDEISPRNAKEGDVLILVTFGLLTNQFLFHRKPLLYRVFREEGDLCIYSTMNSRESSSNPSIVRLHIVSRKNLSILQKEDYDLLALTDNPFINSLPPSSPEIML